MDYLSLARGSMEEVEMTIDYQILFNIMVAVATFLAGWVLNNITKTIEQLDNDVRGMPLNYVTKADYRADLQEIKALLIRIDQKLDGKVDKS